MISLPEATGRYDWFSAYKRPHMEKHRHRVTRPWEAPYKVSPEIPPFRAPGWPKMPYPSPEFHLLGPVARFFFATMAHDQLRAGNL